MKLYVLLDVRRRIFVQEGTFSSREKAKDHAFKIVEAWSLALHEELYSDEEYEYNSTDMWDFVDEEFYIALVDTDYVDRD